jgi:hypothetical protein
MLIAAAPFGTRSQGRSGHIPVDHMVNITGGAGLTPGAGAPSG